MPRLSLATLLLAGFHTRDATPFEAAKYRAEAHSRVATFGNVDAEKRTAELSFSSDIELERWPGFVEKLSHERDAVDMSRLDSGASLLFNHDWDSPIGVVESARIESGKGRATVRFGNSQRAKEVFDDVRDGILKGVSVGYRIIDLKEEKRDGKTVVTATRWQPYEVSIVTVPADISVGVGRTATTHQATHSPSHNTMNRAQLIAALKERGIAYNDSDSDDQLKAKLDAGKRSAATGGAGDDGRRADPVAVERERVRALHEIGRQYGERELAADFAAEGKSVEELRTALLDKIAKRNGAINDANAGLGLNEREIRQFSFLKLIRAIVAVDGERKRASEEAAYELEVCRAAADKVKHRDIKGTLIPVDILRSPLYDLGRRDVVSIKTGTGYAGTGDQVIASTLLAGSFIDLLRNRTVLMNLGTKLTGLVGNLDIPKQISGASASWIGEDEAAADTDVKFGQIGLTPKTVAAKAEITRRMLMQPALDVEALVRADIVKALAQAIDSAGFYGDGTGNAPVGIRNTSGINLVDFAGVQPTFAELVQMETEIEADNISAASSRYIFNSRLRGYFKTAKKFPAGSDSATIWEGGNGNTGSVNGYGAEVTNQIGNDEVFHGDFSEFILGMWGGLELNADPFSGLEKGRLRIVAMQDVDFAIRRAGAFTFGKQLTP